jgi:hypothetical protein
MSESEEIRTPRQIIEEFSQQAASICSGGQARLDKESVVGGEVKDKFRSRSMVTRGRGHSPYPRTGRPDS